MPNQQHVAEELADLITVCRDGEVGYREAAEHARDPELKQLLSEVSQQRTKFARDLEAEAARWGRVEAERSGTTLAAVHRGWTELKAKLGGGDDAILSSMETADDYATTKYDEAIRDEDMPDEIVGILRNQAQAIVGTLDRVRALRRRAA